MNMDTSVRQRWLLKNNLFLSPLSSQHSPCDVGAHFLDRCFVKPPKMVIGIARGLLSAALYALQMTALAQGEMYEQSYADRQHCSSSSSQRKHHSGDGPRRAC